MQVICRLRVSGGSGKLAPNGLQPYADAKGWQVRKGICVKGAVSGVRWIVGEPVSILLKTIFSEGIKSLNHK